MKALTSRSSTRSPLLIRQSISLPTASSVPQIGVDIVIGLGGGSSLDIAKLVAVLLVSDQTLADMHGIGNAKGSRLPLVLGADSMRRYRFGSHKHLDHHHFGETTKMGSFPAALR